MKQCSTKHISKKALGDSQVEHVMVFIYSKKAGEYIGTAKLDKINTESMTAEDGIMIGRKKI